MTDLFTLIYIICIATGVLTGVIWFRHLGTPYRLLNYLLVYTLASELVSEFILKRLDNKMYKNLNYTFYSFVFLSLISRFHYTTAKSRLFKKLILVQWAAIITYITGNSIVSDLTHFPSAQLIVLSFALITLSLYKLGELAQHATEVPITRIPDFYVSSAYLIFFLVNISNWIYHQYFPQVNPQINLFFLWTFNTVCYISYLILAYAIYLNGTSNLSKSIGRT